MPEMDELEWWIRELERAEEIGTSDDVFKARYEIERLYEERKRLNMGVRM